MAGLDLTQAGNILKVFYLPPVREVLNNATILLSRLDKDETTQDVSGKNFTVPIHFSRNESSGVARPEDTDLLSPGAQQYKTAVVPNKFIYGQIRVTGPVIAATRNNVGAFVRAIESEIKGCMRDTKRAVNRQLHGNGVDALAYYVSGSGTAIVVDDGQGNVFTHLQNGGQTIDVLDASASYASLNAGLTATLGSEVATGFNVTLSGAISASVADNDPLVVAGTQSGLTGYAMMGIDGIIAKTNPPLLAGGLHGLDVATNSWWAAQVVDNGGTKRDLSFPLMQKVISKIASNSDFTEKDIKFLLCSFPMRDKYVELAVNERHWYNTMTIDGGFEAVEYNGLPLVPDSQAKRNRIYFIVPETMRIFRSADFDWMDRDGAVLRKVANRDAYEATLFHYGDLGTVIRNGNGLLADLNE
jgi:hypothetical protein